MEPLELDMHGMYTHGMYTRTQSRRKALGSKGREVRQLCDNGDQKTSVEEVHCSNPKEVFSNK